MRRVALLLGVTLLMWACTGGASTTTTIAPTTAPLSSATTTSASVTSVPSSTVVSTVIIGPPPATTTTFGPVLDLGLFCRDLAAAGLGFGEAMAYWVAKSRPARMDADSDGVPCETVFPPEEVQSVLDFDGGGLASGLSCGEVAAHGYGFAEALAYWVREGAPDRMDAEGNGIPCETVYEPWEVLGVISLLDVGWVVSSSARPAGPGCCENNDHAPPSPPFPAPGEPLRDGVYAISISNWDDFTSELEVEVGRWMPCTAQPDRCFAPVEKGDAYTDDTQSVQMVLPLDQTLTVIVDGVYQSPGLFGRDPDMNWVAQVTGDGAAFVRLDRFVDAACGEELVGQREVGGMVLCGGPLGMYLASGWWAALEIRDGSPVLWVWWGQIAG